MDIKQNLKERMQTEPNTADNQPMKVEVNKRFKLTAGELRKACDANSGHPKADIYRRAVRNKPDEATVIVDQVDLEALLDNMDVEVETKHEQFKQGVSPVQRKKLVPRKDKPVQAIAEASPKEGDSKPAKPSK